MRFAVLIAVAALAALFASAQVPGAINYQGRLTTAAGQPVPDGNVRLIVRIFGSLTGNDLVWRSALTQVPVRGGVFALQLGPGFSDEGGQNGLNLGPAVFDGRFTFLEVQPEGQAALAPRTPILATPWAFVAGTVANDAIVTAKLADGAVTNAKLAASSVTSTKIVDGAVATADLADLAVTTPKLADSAVVSAKIADGVVTSGKLASDSGSLAKVTAGAMAVLPSGHIVLPNGRLGIGTMNPLLALDIALGESDMGIRLNNLASGRMYSLISTGSGSFWGPGHFRIIDSTANVDRMVIAPNGNVGIGSNLPQNKLDVFGGATIRNGLDITAGGLNIAAGGQIIQSGGLNVQSGGVSVTGTVTASSEVVTNTVRTAHVVNFGTLYLNPFGGNGAVIVGGVGGTSQLGIGGDPVSTNLLSVHGNATKRDGGTSWAAWSDARLKRDVHPIENPLEKLLALKGRSYRWSNTMDMARHNPGEAMGFIAQEVEAVFPKWISTAPNGYKLLNPIGFEALAVEAVREQEREIERLRLEIRTLRRENAAAIQRLNASFEARLRALEARSNRP